MKKKQPLFNWADKVLLAFYAGAVIVISACIYPFYWLYQKVFKNEHTKE